MFTNLWSEVFRPCKYSNMQSRVWTHPSVRLLAGDRNPIEEILAKARASMCAAMDRGWTGPPFDPFLLAEALKLVVVPREDISTDARTRVGEKGEILLEYNPNRAKTRVRYSIAHEIAHTFFPDFKAQVRHRKSHAELTGDEWQLEMLCNLAAAEILMPVASFEQGAIQNPSIRAVLEQREAFQVSTEALLLRLCRIARRPCAAFSAFAPDPEARRYRVEYVVSGTFNVSVSPGTTLPANTCVQECSAIGFTAQGRERWGPANESMQVEAVGVLPYAGHRFPRVVGLLKPLSGDATSNQLQYVVGDALTPRGEGPKIIAHIVNDATPNWGAGFGSAVTRKWPEVRKHFQAAVEGKRLALGQTYQTEVEPGLVLFHMVAQHGYGPARGPRIRYASLEQALRSLAGYAIQTAASVHMPRIGAGEAGGNWLFISTLIEELLVNRGVRVTIYDLPQASKKGGQLQLIQ
jgi:Zn-dependent peptidase ImmA (M78 family)